METTGFKMLAIIDNYDSFTYNLVHCVDQFVDDYRVFRNDNVTINELQGFDKIIISPGPGLPSEVPFLYQVLHKFSKTKPILGVCLGMQAIAEYYGAKLTNLQKVLHGVPVACSFNENDELFKGVHSPFEVGHYHSWVVEEDSLPPEIQIIARSPDQSVMALKHKTYPVYGVQFHPESVMTPQGLKIIENWCDF